MSYFVYVIKSESTGRSYIGYTKDLENRITEHNSGKSKSTRHGCPWKLVHHEEFINRPNAIRKEMYFKTVDGRRELKDRGIL
jgi:putative endonuclease